MMRQDGAAAVTLDGEPDVQLTAVVPRRVRQAVQRHALEHDTTVRAIILRLLKQAGIADVDEAEITDRRRGR